MTDEGNKNPQMERHSIPSTVKDWEGNEAERRVKEGKVGGIQIKGVVVPALSSKDKWNMCREESLVKTPKPGGQAAKISHHPLPNQAPPQSSILRRRKNSIATSRPFLLMASQRKLCRPSMSWGEQKVGALRQLPSPDLSFWKSSHVRLMVQALLWL